MISWIYKSMSENRELERDKGRDAVVTVRDDRLIEQSGRNTAHGHTRRPKAPITMWDLAIWTYQRQKAHLDSGRVGGIGFGAVSQTAAVLERMHLCGASVGSCAGSRTYCDDDALTVHEMVLRLPAGERALVIGTAATAHRPEWSPAIPPLRALPVKGRKGKPKGIYDQHGHLIGCEIAYTGFLPARATAAVAFAREVHVRWYRALKRLREALISTNEPQRWLIVGIGAEQEPWQQ
jgi:hypothetical protein